MRFASMHTCCGPSSRAAMEKTIHYRCCFSVFNAVSCVLFLISFVTIDGYNQQEYLEPAALRNGELNEPCKTKNDCGTFGFICARNNTCQCAKQYLSDYNKKTCLGGVDQRCQYDEHCINGAFCMSQTSCQCKDKTPFPSLDGLECTSASLRIVPTSLLIFIAILIT